MIRRVVVLVLGLVWPIAAQEPKTGIVQVTVEESMGMVSGLTVRSADQTASTDAHGMARLKLPVGRQVVSITGIGYKPARVVVQIVADSVVTVKVPMTMAEMTMAEVKVSATRIEKLAGETPTRVEVLDEMEVDENKLMAPSGITMLLNETPGLRVVAASPTLGTGSVRILGLPGQYTAMLADGLPLYGGTTAALGPLDVSPVDLQRVEIIKGAASALYGGQALGGVINLISKPATGKNELLINRRTMGVTDFASWLSHRFDEVAGLSLLTSGTVQRAADVDGDGWLDQPSADRWGLRPRFTMADSNGHSVFVTAGHAEDTRNGGTDPGAVISGMPVVKEGLSSRRDDIGARAVLPLRDSGNVAVRFALSRNHRRRDFETGAFERDVSSTAFVEVTRSFVGSWGDATFGSTVQRDAFSNSINGRYDHRWVTPSLFATAERDVGAVTLSLSGRSDFHPEAGTQLTERVALLAKPVEGWSVRLSGGTGFAPPSASNEETEAIGLHAIRPGPKLHPEKSYGTMLDVNGELAGAEVLVTAYASFIDQAIRLADAGDGSGEGILENVSGTTRIGGVESAAIWRFEGGKFLATYGYSRGTRPKVLSDSREPIPLLPRHRAGGDLMFEKEGKYRGGIEGIWYGRQHLDDNPFRSEAKPYFYLMAIYMRQFGRAEAVANFENLLNVRQTDTDPLVRPAQTTGGRWTTDVWAPLEGFMANVALRYRW
jgi:outer membrane receptor for ferrienterochelin and colicins